MQWYSWEWENNDSKNSSVILSTNFAYRILGAK